MRSAFDRTRRFPVSAELSQLEAGVFFSAPAPPVIGTLEYVHVGVLLVTLLPAWSVYRESSPGRSASRDA